MWFTACRFTSRTARPAVVLLEIRSMSIKILMTTAALLTLGCFGFESSAQAGLLGKTLSIGLYPSSSLTTPLTGTSVSFSVSGSIEIGKWQSALNGPASIDVSDTQIKIANIAESASSIWSPSRYIGFKDVNGTIDDFSTDILKTFFSHTVPGISASNLTVTASMRCSRQVRSRRRARPTSLSVGARHT